MGLHKTFPILDWNSKLKEEWEQGDTGCKVSLCKKERASLCHFSSPIYRCFLCQLVDSGGNFSRAEELPFSERSIIPVVLDFTLQGESGTL